MARALALLLAAGVLACAGAPAPTVHYYRLEAAEPAPLASPAIDGVLLVERPRAEAFLSQRNLAYRRAAELLRHAHHRWTDPPPRMLEQEIARSLRAAGVARSVVTSGLRAEPDAILHTRIRRLEQDEEREAAVVELEFALERMPGGELLIQESWIAEQRPASDSVAAGVAAQNAALNEVLERLLDALR